MFPLSVFIEWVIDHTVGQINNSKSRPEYPALASLIKWNLDLSDILVVSSWAISGSYSLWFDRLGTTYSSRLFR